MNAGILYQGHLDSKADGIAAYLRCCISYAQNVQFTLWGANGAHDRSGASTTGQHLTSRSRIAAFLPRRVSYLLALWLYRAEIESRVDVVFAQTSESVVPLAWPRLRRPIVLVMHGWNPPEIARSRGTLHYLWLRLCDAIAVRAASRIILVSKEGYDGFSRRYRFAIDKFVHIPTFIDDCLLQVPSRESVRDRLGMRGEPTLVTIGRLVPEKQVDKAIEVFAALKARVPAAQLVIVGDGPEREKLSTLCVSLGVKDAVSFRGEVAHDSVGSYLAGADFFLLLSRWEGTSIALLEALALGIPTVLTDIADHRLLVEQAKRGIVVHPDHIVEEASAWLETACSTAGSGQARGSGAKSYLASAIVPSVVRELDLAVANAGPA